jgi:hypothetical protein
MLNRLTMITVVIVSYAILMLTILLAMLGAARRSVSKRKANTILEAPFQRPTKVVRPTSLTPSKVHGGTEVLAFGA